jgi:O-antigen ligase
MVRISRIEPLIIFLFIFTQIAGLSILVYTVPSLGSLIGTFKYLIFLLPIIYLLKGFYIEWRMLLVITIFITTILINNIDPIFQSEFRLISWILLIFAVGPFVLNEFLINFRKRLLTTLLITFMIMGSISFLWWLVGLPSLGRGHYTGLFTHSMLLAPIAAMGSIFSAYKTVSSDKQKFKLIYLFLFISNFISLLLSASRGALAGTLFVLFIFLIFAKIKYKKTLIILSLIIGFFSLQFVSINLSNSNITQKIANRGIDNTRAGLWHDRIMEFNSSPIFGVGFASQDLTLDGRLGKGASEEGGVEPGSTYLMILSMTGLLGLFSLIILFSKYLTKIKKLKQPFQKPELYILIFFLVHFISEGYLYSSGSLMAFTFWLLIGATYPTNYEKNVQGIK